MKKDQKEKSTKALTVPSDVNSLLQLAIKNKTGLDTVKELMKMKYEHEAREAKKVFHAQFYLMQSEFPIIRKGKDVNRSNDTKIYSYTPIEEMVRATRDAMSKYGFSYSFSEESIKEGWKRVHCYAKGHGHVESAYADIPIQPGNAMTNNVQQTGSATTYGKRYSFADVFGIMCSDEDDDGRGAEIKKDNSSQPQQNKKPPVEVKAEVVKDEPKKSDTVRQEIVKLIWSLCKEIGCKNAGEARELCGVPFDTDNTITIERLYELKSELEARKKNDADSEAKKAKLLKEEKENN